MITTIPQVIQKQHKPKLGQGFWRREEIIPESAYGPKARIGHIVISKRIQSSTQYGNGSNGTKGDKMADMFGNVEKRK